MKLIRPALVMLAFSLGIVACGDRNTPDDSTPDASFRGLKVVGDKAAFTESMREALRKRYSGQSPSGDLVDESADLGTAPPSASDTLASSAGDGPSVTGTNVQEVGVDEADRIKTDGNFLYVLNTGFQATDLPLDTDLPVDEPGDTVSQTSIPFPGNQTTQIRILSLDTEAATSTLITELDVDTGNESASGMYLHKADGADSLIVTSSSFGGYWGYWGSSREFMGQQSTIRKIDVTTPASASVVDSLSLEGQIISSRRIGQYLYVASRFTPQIPQDTVDINETIDVLDVDDLLPVATRVSDGTVQELADANNCFVTQKPANGYYSPDVITLAAIDITTMTVSGNVCYLGATETLYASTNSIYLATTQYAYTFAVSPLAETDDVAISIPESDPRVNTDIHQFDITDGTLTYAGSGQVDGHLGWNDLQKPFRMSEKDGYLRVATHSDSQRGDTSPVFVSVLKPVDGNLDVVAKIPRADEPNIGKLREQLHATRFLGDKGYLVTFRQTDPLYVVDLSDPENPTVAGELEIDGYSDYLHPIGQDYLLGIGKGAIANTGGLDGDFRGAFAQGVKVSLFDVSDPAAPSEVQAIEIGKRGSDADALRDHHGITVQPGTDVRPTRLAFGINVNEDALNGQDPGDPSAWYNWSRSGLFAFEIETGANAGITEHGSIIVESRSDNPQAFGPMKGNDRSVIADDTVFYIHGEDVYGANWNALNPPDGPR